MNKAEIKRGMKMARKKHDQLLDQRFVTKNEYNSGTAVANASGLKISVGTTQPTDTKTIWINTTNYWGV